MSKRLDCEAVASKLYESMAYSQGSQPRLPLKGPNVTQDGGTWVWTFSLNTHRCGLEGRISQPWHHWHLGPTLISVWETVLCVVGRLTTSLVTTYLMPIAPLFFSSCDSYRGPQRGQNHPLLQNHCWTGLDLERLKSSQLNQTGTSIMIKSDN